MRRSETKYIVYHCSATKPSQDIGAKEIRQWHLARGFGDIGYAIVIRRNGQIEWGRHPDDIGAHVQSYNSKSIGVCMVGGLDDQGRSFASRPDLYAPQQWESAELVAKLLHRAYPGARVVGHRDLSPDVNHDGVVQPTEWVKACPCFDAQTELGDVL